MKIGKNKVQLFTINLCHIFNFYFFFLEWKDLDEVILQIKFPEGLEHHEVENVYYTVLIYHKTIKFNFNENQEAIGLYTKNLEYTKLDLENIMNACMEEVYDQRQRLEDYWNDYSGNQNSCNQ